MGITTRVYEIGRQRVNCSSIPAPYPDSTNTRCKITYTFFETSKKEEHFVLFFAIELNYWTLKQSNNNHSYATDLF